MTLSLALAMSRSLARAFSLFEEDDIVRKTTFNPSAQKKKRAYPLLTARVSITALLAEGETKKKIIKYRFLPFMLY